MSFTLTTPQILARTKTVTRRVGWSFLKVGDRLQAIEKGQGLKKGEKVKRLAVIEVRHVSRCVLGDITPQDVWREGFPQMTTREFIEMFKKANGGVKDQIVTRIEFRYVGEIAQPAFYQCEDCKSQRAEKFGSRPCEYCGGPMRYNDEAQR